MLLKVSLLKVTQGPSFIYPETGQAKVPSIVTGIAKRPK